MACNWLCTLFKIQSPVAVLNNLIKTQMKYFADVGLSMGQPEMEE